MIIVGASCFLTSGSSSVVCPSAVGRSTGLLDGDWACEDKVGGNGGGLLGGGAGGGSVSLRIFIGGGMASSRSKSSSSLCWKISLSSISVGEGGAASLLDSGAAEFTLQKCK